MNKEALKELIIIELAKRNFYDFCVYMDPRFFTKGKPHLKLIADAFQKVYEGIIKKLAVSMPPRAGKSYITSLFCAWVIGKEPTESIMRNSYAASLAEKFSYDIRDIVQKEKYLKVFPYIKLRRDKQKVEEWAVEQARTGLTYFCAGVGGAITGKGCTKIAILDDPIKNIEEAMSETVIENIWNWYTSTHLSRLETGCAEIHIATRWSKKDPIGRLTDEFSENYSDDWTVIVIPALVDGETFCEEIKTTEEYMSIRKVTDEFIWEAEFMQNPVESKGLLYPTEQLNKFSLNEIATKRPDGIIGFTDTADKGSDFLCSLIGQKFGDYTYITDIVFTQDGVEVTEPLVAQMIIDTKADLMKIESNNGGESFARNVKGLLKKYNNKIQSLQDNELLPCACSIRTETQTTNKETRILMSAGYIKEYFYFRNDYEPGSDYDKYMRQLTSYVKLGKNKHDDAADATTGLADYVKVKKFKKPEEPSKFPINSMDDRVQKNLERLQRGRKKSNFV